MSKDNRVSKSDFKKYLEEFEWVKKNFDNYKRELDLIDEKNPYECELYSVIANVIRCCMHDESISLRDVSRIQNYEKFHTDNFMSKGGFPDFIVLGEKYDKSAKVNENDIQKYGIYGAIEVKYMFKRLIINEDTFQLSYKNQIQEHIRYFKKVIYTNGLVWQFYLFDDLKPERDTRDIERDELIKEFVLGTVEKGKINWELNAEEVFGKLVGFLRAIDWKLCDKWTEEI